MRRAQVGVRADEWRAREAKSGRIYDCGKRSVAGYPFRLEVRCDDASVTLVSQTAGAAAPFTAQLERDHGDRLDLPAETADRRIQGAGNHCRSRPAAVAEGELEAWAAAASPACRRRAVERIDLVFENPAIDRINGPVQTPLAKATHVELHGRIAEGSPQDHPVIETVLQIAGGSIQEVHPLLAQPFDADVQTKLSGLKDFAPKPWPERFREIQAAGGHVEIVRSRIQQGDLVAVAAGTLGLNASGRIDGELQMTVAGIEKVIPALGIEKMLEEGVPQATLDKRGAGREERRTSTISSARSTRRFPASARSSSRTPMSASPPASTRSAPQPNSKARRRAPSRCASSTARCSSARSRSAQIPPLF